MAMFGGLFGRKQPQLGQSPQPWATPPYAGAPEVAGVDMSIPTDPYGGQRPNGGILGTGATLGDVGRGALAGVADGIAQWAGQKPVAVPAMIEGQQAQAAAQQAQRLAILKSQLREPTALQRNFEYLGIDPMSERGQQVGVDSMVRPITIGDAVGGQQIISPSAPQSQTINGQTYYFVNGQWFDNPEGK